jgi:hypothetical protein
LAISDIIGAHLWDLQAGRLVGTLKGEKQHYLQKTLALFQPQRQSHGYVWVFLRKTRSGKP